MLHRRLREICKRCKAIRSLYFYIAQSRTNKRNKETDLSTQIQINLFVASVTIGLQMVLFHIMQTWRSLLWKDLQLNYWHILLINRPKKIAWVHTDFEKHHWTNVIFKNKQNEEQTYSRYHQIVTVSVTVQKAFIKAFPLVKSLVKIIYNPIDHEDIIKKGKQYEPLPSKSKIRLISIGRLTKVKAYSRLLHIALRLKQSGYAFELWILGDGEEREMLQHYICKKQLEDCVTLWGFQTNPYAFMTQSDLFVCSSISEGYSTAVTEALILGLPVVTTDCSGMNELLQGEKYGIITENSEATLFEGIKQLLDHPEQLSHYKEKVIKRGKEFTLEVLMKPIETLLTR